MLILNFPSNFRISTSHNEQNLWHGNLALRNLKVIGPILRVILWVDSHWLLMSVSSLAVPSILILCTVFSDHFQPKYFLWENTHFYSNFFPGKNLLWVLTLENQFYSIKQCALCLFQSMHMLFWASKSTNVISNYPSTHLQVTWDVTQEQHTQTRFIFWFTAYTSVRFVPDCYFGCF